MIRFGIVSLWVLAACQPEPLSPPQSTTLAKQAPPSSSSAMPTLDREALAHGYDALMALHGEVRDRAITSLDLAPAPCASCGDASIAACAQHSSGSCPVLGRLVSRAARLARRGDTMEQIDEALSIPDLWFDFPALDPQAADPQGPVAVELWMDLSSPFLVDALHTAQAITQPGVSVHLRHAPDARHPFSQELAMACIAAQQQGLGMAFAQATAAWRESWRSGGSLVGLQRDPSAEIAAQTPGLDLDVWRAALGGGSTRLQTDAALARTLGVRAVPTWFVAGYRLRGDQSITAIGRLVRLELDDRRALQDPQGSP